MSCQECFVDVLPYKITGVRSTRVRTGTIFCNVSQLRIYTPLHTRLYNGGSLSAKPVRFAYLERAALLLSFRLPLFFFSPKNQERLASWPSGKEGMRQCDWTTFFLFGEAERSSAKVGRLNENPVCFMQCDNKSL